VSALFLPTGLVSGRQAAKAEQDGRQERVRVAADAVGRAAEQQGRQSADVRRAAVQTRAAVAHGRRRAGWLLPRRHRRLFHPRAPANNQQVAPSKPVITKQRMDQSCYLAPK
jgi:hypothetical protein